VILKAHNVDIAGSMLDVRGGAGGTGGYTGISFPEYNAQGGDGGAGWIRLESSSGSIVGEAQADILPGTSPSFSIGTIGQMPDEVTQGQSRFFDTGVENPDYVDNASGGFSLNVTLNNSRVRVFVQGAQANAMGQPDPETLWPNNTDNGCPLWELAYDSHLPSTYIEGASGGINAVDRYRFIRFRIVFDDLLIAFPPGPFISDITMPFRD